MSQQSIDDFLMGIAEATNALISQNLEEGIIIALDTLCENLDVTASTVYVSHLDEQGQQVASLKYFISKEDNQERVNRNQSIPFTLFKQLHSSLVGGLPYEVVLSESEGGLRQHMSADHTMSVAFFPILVGSSLWGALGLTNMTEEKRWSPSEKSLLLSLANSIGAAIEREGLQNNLENLVQKRTSELADSRLRFQLAIEGTQNGIWDWEPQTGKIFWSQNMYKNLGYEEGDIPDLIDGFYDLIHPNEREEARRRFNDYLMNRVPYVMEFRLLKKNGDYHWFKSTCKAVWDEEGKPVRVVGSHADIHARKVYTDLLIQQEEKFRAVVRNDPNALFLINKQREILLHSDRSVDVFGYSKNELSNMKFDQLLPSNLRETHAEFMDGFFKNPSTHVLGQDHGLKGRRRNGGLFNIEIGLSPVSLEGDTLVMAVVTDVSEKLESEAKLQESYRQINNLINSMPGIVYHCRNDRFWSMDYISPACEQITGYKQEDFYGWPSTITYADLIVAEERDETWNKVQESLAKKDPFRMIYRIRDKSGEQKWIWEQGVGVFNQKGEVLGLEGCIFDISPIIRNQERINQAIYATEVKERARMASDLHDGVQQILGASTLNLKSMSEEIQKLSLEAQEHYHKSLNYLQQGIRESRDIAHRLMPREIEELGLDRSIQQLLDELKSNLKIKISYYNNITAILSPEIELGLYRVVQESFNNISKYSKATKVNVQLISDAEGIQLMIEDNGIGFDENKIDLYKQGFGLAAMKNRILALSGQLTVDSKYGKGTCIVVWIPWKIIQQDETDQDFRSR